MCLLNCVEFLYDILWSLFLDYSQKVHITFSKIRIANNTGYTSARPEVRGTADVGWRSLNPLPINLPRTHSRLYHHMCLRTDGR